MEQVRRRDSGFLMRRRYPDSYPANERYVVRFKRLSPARGHGTLRTSFRPRITYLLGTLIRDEHEMTAGILSI